MAVPPLKGERVLLREPRESDSQDRLVCGRHPEFARMVGGDPHPRPYTAEDAGRWYRQAASEPFHWAVEAGGRCVGSARLHHLDPANRRARYGIGLFDTGVWGQGMGTEATRLVLQFAFRHLRLHRVDLRVLAFNKRAIACYRKCAFVQEGVEREGVLIDGEWQSDVWMSILDREYAETSKRWTCDDG